MDWYDLIVPSSEDEERKLKYIKSISSKEDDSLAGAEQIYNDILEQEKQIDIIKKYMSFLNESGKNKAISISKNRTFSILQIEIN